MFWNKYALNESMTFFLGEYAGTIEMYLTVSKTLLYEHQLMRLNE